MLKKFFTLTLRLLEEGLLVSCEFINISVVLLVALLLLLYFLNTNEYPLLPGCKFNINVFKFSLIINFSNRNDVLLKFS